MTQLSQTTQQNASASEELASTAEEMSTATLSRAVRNGNLAVADEPNERNFTSF